MYRLQHYYICNYLKISIHNLGADLSCNIPFVFLRLKAPRSISVCILLLFELDVILTLPFMLELFFVLVELKSGFPLSNVDNLKEEAVSTDELLDDFGVC